MTIFGWLSGVVLVDLLLLGGEGVCAFFALKYAVTFIYDVLVFGNLGLLLGFVVYLCVSTIVEDLR